tara:strand:- start:1506 stop:2708 length:1203 start_codon:yes stop_codon:yes gene_type:complete
MKYKLAHKNKKESFLKNKLRIFILLIKYIISSKIIFNKPRSHEVVIFDCESSSDIENVLHKFDYTILSTRAHRIKKIYATKRIIKFIVLNFFKRSIKQNYLIKLIEEINPKVVITHIDNSTDFYILSKYFYKRIKFIAVQRANRETKWLSLSDCKKIFIPEYLCFSSYDKYIYKSKKTNVKIFHTLGSMVASLAYKYTKDKKIKINPAQYDICLIGEAQPPRKFGDASHLDKLPYTVGTLAEYTHRFCKKHNLKLIFSGAENKKDKDYEIAINFYKGYLKNYNFKYALKKNHYSGYINVMRSKVVIGSTSTLLRESLSFNKKVLCCNFSDRTHDIFELPVKKQFILRKSSYELFEKKLLKILSLSKKKYLTQIGKDKNYFMSPSYQTVDYIQSRVEAYIK